MLLPVEIKNHPCMSGGACQCGGSCGGCGRQAALKPRLGSLDGYRVGYQKNADWDDDDGWGPSEDVIRFGKDYPYHSDLELIQDRRRTLMGNGRFDIPGRRAGLLARMGLVDIVEGIYGKELHLTGKGERYLDRSQDAFDRL